LEYKDSIQKLVAKIYLILGTKIIYADSAEMEKHFYKRFTTYLCAIFGTRASHDISHNISEN
jgi:hypothetical protein